MADNTVQQYLHQALVDQSFQLNDALRAIYTDLTQLYEDTGWIDVTFENSWVNYGGSIWQDAQYRKENGWVYIRGLVKDGTVNSAIFTLPEGFRPAKQEMFITVASDPTTNIWAKTYVLADGIVQTAGVPAGYTSFQSLSGLIVRAEQ